MDYLVVQCSGCSRALYALCCYVTYAICLYGDFRKVTKLRGTDSCCKYEHGTSDYSIFHAVTADLSHEQLEAAPMLACIIAWCGLYLAVVQQQVSVTI